MQRFDGAGEEWQFERRGSVGVAPRKGWARVLVVEDDPYLSRALAARMAAEGLEVRVADDGLAAARELAEAEPDLVLLDVHLPRLHGFKFLHRLREHHDRDVPVVVLTGDPDPRVTARALRWGVRRVLHKPMSNRRVVDIVRDCLEG